MRTALAQIDPTVGDVDGNAARIAEWIGHAAEAGAELAIFPELCLPGYPAEDLYLKAHFLAANRIALDELARGVAGISVLVGFAEPVGDDGFRHAYNSVALLADGEVRAVYRKNRLPNYAVFDEQRYFVPGSEPLTVDVAGVPVGLTICEDCWMPGPPGQ
ncbi:MAG: nitrilase-related carbon-nitrogen hydrolase, partial [Syntrophothermus sp.]